MTGAKLARANLPARVWIEWWQVYPLRPWVVTSERGIIMRAYTPDVCKRWLARYGYAPQLVNEEGFTGTAYVRTTTDAQPTRCKGPPRPRNAV